MRRTVWAWVSDRISIKSHPIRPLTLEEALLQLSLCDLNLDGFVNLLVVTTLVIGVVLDCG